MRTRKERSYFSGKKHRLRLFGLICLLVLLGGAIAFAGTELIASNSVNVAGIEYYAALDDEWQRINMAKTVPGKDSSGRYYTTSNALEEFYGKFGFSAKDYNGEMWFPHTVAGDSGRIWGDAKTEKTTVGGWKIPLASKDKIYVYYLPKGAAYDTEGKTKGSFAVDSENGRDALKKNMFYSVALSDPDKKMGEEKAEVKYVASGGSYSVTLPADNGYEWEAVNRKTLAALSSNTKVTKTENGDKTITLTFTNISEPVKIQPVTSANTQLKIIYNAATVNDNLQEMGDSSASIQTAETNGKINKQDSFTFYMDTTDAQTNIKVLSPDSNKALVKVNGSSQGKKFWYSFAGWRLGGTGTILSPNDTMTLQQLQQYEVDGEIQLDAVWKGRNEKERIDSANFYVNKNCEIADNMSSGAGQIPSEGFTKSVYTARVDDQADNVTLDSKGAYLLLAPNDENSNAYEVDSEIRQLTKKAVNNVSMGSFPSDEDVLSNLRANYDTKDPIKVDGKVIPKEKLTSANFTVRWYSVKYQKSDGWHVDGILVAKAGKIVVTKTISGGADVAVEALKKQDFNIEVSHVKDPTANDPEQEDYKLVLKDKNATGADAPATGETGYDSYDENTHTYTWVLTVRDYQQYEIREKNYKLDSFDRSEHTYHIRHNEQDENIREDDENFTWAQYDEKDPITVTADSYADDAPQSSYQTVELKNLYVTSSFITLDKMDSFTVDGMTDISFTVSKLSSEEEATPFTLYRRPGTNAYSDQHDDTHGYGFTEDAGNTIQTDSTGLVFLKFPAGTYLFKEQTPEGYQSAAAFKVVVKNYTDKAGTYIDSAVPCKADGTTITGAQDYVYAVKDSSIITVKNKAEQLTTVTAKANMGDVDAESVQVELWCNGAKLAGSQYTQTLNKGNNWTYKWENLPLYTNGNIAKYTLRETRIGDTAYDPGVNGDGYADYVVTYDDCKYREAADGEYNDQASWTDDKGKKHYAKHALLVVNNENYQIPQQYINVDVQINWDDSNDQDGSRPKNVNVKLLDDNGNQAGTERSLNHAGSWKGTYLQLAKYKDNKEIQYAITENSFATPAGYTAAISGNIEDGFTITLKHTPKSPATLTGDSVLQGEKILTGRDMKAGEKFDFALEAADDATKAALDDNSITIANGGTHAAVTGAKKGEVKNFRFGEMTFRKAGTYTFNMKETLPEDQDSSKSGVQKDGVTYDSHTAKVIATVTDNGSGQLAAAVSTEGTSFTNAYEAADLELNEVCQIKATNVLYGHSAAEGQFRFKLKAADADSAKKLPMSLDADRTLTIDSPAATDSAVAAILSDLPITLTQADVGKTYTYTLQENQGNAGGYTYDSSKYELQITAKDAADGTLQAEVKLLKNGKKVAEKTVSTAHPASGDDGIVMAFENYYKASTEVSGGAKAEIKATKTLQGRSLKADEFTFHLKTRPIDGSDGETLQTKKNGADGSISFAGSSYKTAEGAAGANAVVLSEALDGDHPYGEKSVTEDGKDVYTLHYTVCEDKTALPAGVSAEADTFNVDVVVTDNGDGTLSAAVQYPDGKTSCDFVNVYSTGGPVPFAVHGSKSLDHVTGLTPGSIAEKFTFTLSAETAGAPMPANTTAKNDAEGNIDFGEITYKLEDLNDVDAAADGSRTKTFEYKVTESGSAAGVTNDAASGKTFAVTLKDDGKGHFTVTSDVKEGALFSFVNTYSVGELSSGITDQISVNKTLTGRDLKAGEFQFELLEDGEVVATGTNDADGMVTFGAVKYTEPGSHLYTVREVQGDAAGVTYDTQEYMIRTQVTDQGNGSLKAEHQLMTLDNDELTPADQQNIRFTNTYVAKETSVNLEAVKHLTGAKLKDGQFTFQLKDESGNVVDEAANDKDGVIAFKELSFDAVGTYHYTISEINDKQKDIKYDDSEKTVVITVKDGGNGTLEASMEISDELVFTNAYEAGGSGGDPSDDPGNNGSGAGTDGNGGTGQSSINGSGAKTGDPTDIALALGLMLIAATTAGILLVRRRLER